MSFIGTAVGAGTAVWGAASAAAPVIGAGVGLYGAISGGGGGTSSGTAGVKMTPRGRSLEPKLSKSLQTDLFPENLASQFIGDAKKMFQARKRISSRVITSAAATGPERAVTGNVAKGLLAETSLGLGEASAGARKVGREKRAFSLESLNEWQNFINLQSGSSVMQAQADLVRTEMGQARGAGVGAGLGGFAQLLAAERVLS